MNDGYIDFDPTYIERLQNDFNKGEPFVLEKVAPVVQTISYDMGFNYFEVLEAHLVLESSDQTQLIDYLLGESFERKKKYEQKKQQYQINSSKEILSLKRELENLQKELAREEHILKDLERENKRESETGALRLEYYTEFVRGITELDMMKEIQHTVLERYKLENHITAEEHIQTIQKLRINIEEWKYKTNNLVPANAQERGDHCVFPCMHSISAAAAMRTNEHCPICQQKLSRIQKIFI